MDVQLEAGSPLVLFRSWLQKGQQTQVWSTIRLQAGQFRLRVSPQWGHLR